MDNRCDNCHHHVTAHVNGPCQHSGCDCRGFQTVDDGTNKQPSTKDVALELIEGRQAVYGNPAVVFKDHAAMWSVILGTEVRADQVALCLIAYKLVRANTTPDYSDNIDDVIGYADIFKKILGNDLINARSVDEYLETKGARQGSKTAKELYDEALEAMKNDPGRI
jgi:hypothetical protein